MKKGLILINAYLKLEHELNQSTRLKAELEKRGIEIDVRRNDFFAAIVERDGSLKTCAADYDFCVYLDKDKYVSYALEKAGLRLFNPHSAIRACDDKMETALVLSDCKIPTPKTMPGLLCYNPTEDIREQTLDRLEENLGYPIVVKTSYGSLGKGVFKADNRKELRQLCEELKCQPHLFQQYIAKSFGTDIRVIVVGGKCIAAMMRKSDGDFRSNLELGGTGTAITPPDEVQKMCEKVARLLSLDYAGIDVLIGNDGYYLCEVNSNAFFGGIEQVTGTNIAAIYAEHIIKTIYH